MMKKLGSFFMDILEVVVFAIAIFLFVYLLILQPHKIRGTSMEPNFPNGEYLLTDKLSYRFGGADRGDVVVFEPPGSDGDEFIKRIIGLPGERIMLQNGKLFINGQELIEDYLPDNLITQAGPFLSEGVEITIPTDRYFVLGDNRNASSDSRVWGFVSKSKITGRAWVVYWPMSSAGLIEKPAYSYSSI
jgi:signal peptidase I